MKDKVIIVDLDGTLASKNTFHEWLKYLLFNKINSSRYLGNIILKINIILFCILRFLRIISHSKFKFLIQKIYYKHSSEEKLNTESLFIKRILSFINNDVINFIDIKNKNINKNIYILATAAPENYSSSLSTILNFDYLLSTPVSSSLDWYDNIKSNKLNSVKILLDSVGRNVKDSILITDHLDDFPLVQEVSITYALNPLAKKVDLVKSNNKNIKIKNFYNET